MAARLTQTDKYIIQKMTQDGKSQSEISSFIKKPAKLVEKFLSVELDKLRDTIVNAQMEANPAPLSKPTGIITRTSSGKRGVAVMTEDGSGIGDECTKKTPRKVGRTSKGNLYDASGNQITD